MKRLIQILLLLIPLVNWAQPYSITWDGSTSVAPWVELDNPYSVVNQRVCQGTHSIRTRLTGLQGLSASASLRSPLLFTATGGIITFSFDYKWLLFNNNSQT